MCKALSITVCGDVKGVGFRRFVWSLAKRFGLVGFVENISGRNCVHVYVESDENMLNEYIAKISSNKIYRIDAIDIREGACSGKYTDFIIVKCLGEEEI